MAVRFHAANISACPPPFTQRSHNFSSSKPFKLSPTRPTSLLLRASVVSQQELTFTEEENQLIAALIGIQGRGKLASPQQLNDVERAVKVLEDLPGVPDPILKRVKRSTMARKKGEKLRRMKRIASAAW